MNNTIKMITTFIMGAVLSYFTVKVFSHYLGKNGVFNLNNPVEFIIVFAIFVFYILFSYKTCNEFEEVLEENPAKPEVKYFKYDPNNYTHYEDLGKNSPLK